MRWPPLSRYSRLTTNPSSSLNDMLMKATFMMLPGPLPKWSCTLVTIRGSLGEVRPVCDVHSQCLLAHQDLVGVVRGLVVVGPGDGRRGVAEEGQLRDLAVGVLPGHERSGVGLRDPEPAAGIVLRGHQDAVAILGWVLKLLEGGPPVRRDPPALSPPP